MKTFMEHVLTPAAKIVWSVNAVVVGQKARAQVPVPQDGRRLGTDRQRRRDACRSHQRLDHPAAGARSAVERLRQKVRRADTANKAYRAAEARDLKAISEVSDRLDGICAACHRHYGLE